MAEYSLSMRGWCSSSFSLSLHWFYTPLRFNPIADNDLTSLIFIVCQSILLTFILSFVLNRYIFIIHWSIYVSVVIYCINYAIPFIHPPSGRNKSTLFISKVSQTAWRLCSLNCNLCIDLNFMIKHSDSKENYNSQSASRSYLEKLIFVYRFKIASR